MALMAEHDNARQTSRQCARTRGALTRVRRACLWRAQQAVPTSTDPMGILKNTREFKAPGAGKEHTSEVRAGSRDPVPCRTGFVNVAPKYLCQIILVSFSWYTLDLLILTFGEFNSCELGVFRF